MVWAKAQVTYFNILKVFQKFLCTVTIFLNNHLIDYYTMNYCLKRKNKKRFFSFQSMPNLNFAELMFLLRNPHRAAHTAPKYHCGFRLLHSNPFRLSMARKPSLQNHHFPIQYRYLRPRRKSLPLDTAGEAQKTSLSLFTTSISNFGPGLII